MKCPNCAHDDTTVAETESVEHGVLRWRACAACQSRFATLEQLRPVLVTVVKRDGRREPFQREKLLAGLTVSARKRPLPTGSLDAIIEDVERRLLAAERDEIPSRVIGEMAISHLKTLDPIAYIRFASAYRQFISLDDMLDELQRMQDSPLPPAEQGRLFADLDPLVDPPGGWPDPAPPVPLADAEAAPLPQAPTPIESAPSAALRASH